MRAGWLLGDAVNLLEGLAPWLAGDNAGVVLGASVAGAAALTGYALLRRRVRSARLAGELRSEALRLKEDLRTRLAEQPALLADAPAGAPTIGAREAFEGDIEAAAASVLAEAGGRRGKAKQILRHRLNGHGGASRLNGSEAGTWRQLGALSLLDSTQDALIAYTRAADLSPDDAELQMLLGVLALRAGKLEAAEAAFRRQMRLAEDHNDEEAHYRGNAMLGDVLGAKGETDEALTAYEQAQRGILALTERQPQNPRWRRDLSMTHDRIGDVLLSKGELALALESYRASLALVKALAEAHTLDADLQRDLSIGYERVAEVLEKQGDLENALTNGRAGLAIAAALAERFDKRVDWQWDLSVSHDRLGDILAAKGKTAEALRHYGKSLAIAEVLVERCPGNVAWQRDLAASYHKAGLLEAAEGDDAKARQHLEKGRTIIRRLVRIAAHQAQWRADLARFDAALRSVPVA
jgi:tetratricopeptide (TPR) repeat protein